jgi:hypothetical protein
MAARSNAKGQKKMGRFARRLARIERRSLRILMVPMIVVAQRRMMKTLEHMA